MKSIECATQAELDAVPAGTVAIVRKGFFVARGSATVRAGGQSTVRAWDQSTVEAGGQSTVEAWGQSTVEAWGQSTVRAGGQSTVEAWDQSTVRAWDQSTVRAWGQSTVRAWDQSTVEAGGQSTVEAGGQSTVRAGGQSTVRAWDQSTVEAGGQSTVRAWGQSTVHSTSPVVPIQTKGPNVTVTGKAIVIPIDMPGDAEGWCERQGVTVDGDTAVLYKVVGPDWKSGWGVAYEPGTTVEAPDWDPEVECGGGLHFVGRPFLTAEWDQWNGGGHIVACRVRVDEIVAHPDGMFPDKVKAPRVLEVFEVDRDGNRIEGA